jgi:hypothetical protein
MGFLKTLGRIGAAALTFGASEGAIAGVKAAKGIKLPGTKLNPRKEQVELLVKELELYKNDANKLGLSNAEKQQQVDAATRQASAQAGNQNQQLGQMALAGQGFQQGAFSNAAAGAQDSVANVAASASANAEAAHLQKIEMARERIMQGLAAERLTRRQNREYWANYVMAGVQTVASVFVPGAGSGGTPAPTATATEGTNSDSSGRDMSGYA